jgi:hypothetical protein
MDMIVPGTGKFIMSNMIDPPGPRIFLVFRTAAGAPFGGGGVNRHIRYGDKTTSFPLGFGNGNLSSFSHNYGKCGNRDITSLLTPTTVVR